MTAPRVAAPPAAAPGGPPAPPTARGRALRLAGVGAVTAATAWLLWPRPALTIEVDPAGVGRVVTRAGRSALPETLFVAGGRNAEVRLVNRSARDQQLGIFSVAAGETRSYRVGAPGTYGGYCSAHPTSKQLVYVVR